MNLHECLATNNACYKAGQRITVRGIMVHSTGANNPNLRRYVQPDDGLLGVNPYNNHFNTNYPGGSSVCVHAFIGKLADGSIATYQILPWNYRGWHAGGSANNTHIGFEICEDGLTDSVYFNKVYQEAVDLCVYLCKLYGLTEKDIICHSEGSKKGVASNHADVMHWFPKHGKSMDTFRAAVKAALNGAVEPVTPVKPSTTATATTSGRIDTVKEVQLWLNQNYSAGLTLDGLYGTLTKRALTKALQKALGVTADGIYGKNTKAAAKKNNLKKGSKGALVKVLQGFLVCHGYKSAYVDGSFGSGTETALKAFQTAYKLTADGIAGSNTFLALCS